MFRGSSRIALAGIGLGVVLAGAVGCDQAPPLISATPDDPIFRPERLDFGVLPLGRTSTDTIVVTNPNGTPVVLTSLRVEGADRAHFDVDVSEIEVPSNRTRQVVVRFSPMKLGRVQADLEIFHTESSMPAVVTLVGTGTVTGPSPCVDDDDDGYPFGCPEATDCDDDNGEVHPGAEEKCDNVDNDCNGRRDDGLTGLRFVDADRDTYGTGTATVVSICPEPQAYAERDGDCRDDLFEVNPAAQEICDGLDNDCNTVVDDGLPLSTFYRDGDSDTFGDAASSTTACAATAGYVAQAGDCDDTRADVNPLQAELCDGIDNNCNRVADEGLTTQTFYADVDMDGFGDVATASIACQPIPGWVTNAGDCDDNHAPSNPNGTEVCVGGFDEDCDRLIDLQDPDCQCTTQNDCGPSSNGSVCPRNGAPVLQCRPLCRNPSDCVAGEACRPLPGGTGLGFCLPTTGVVPENGACNLTAECSTGICFDGLCKRVCQSQADCTGGDVCGVALYSTAEIGGAAVNRQTMLCQPSLGRQAIGTGNCLINSTNADTAQCATTHCDLLPWLALQAAQPRCMPMCAGAGDCGPAEVCGMVYYSALENPPIPSTQEGAGRFHDGILGCYTPLFFNGVSWQSVPPGLGGLGAPCTASTARLACRSHQCASFSPIANRCTDFCDDDSDCVTPQTPNWRCLVGELSMSGVFLQSLGAADITKFSLVGVCAP